MTARPKSTKDLSLSELRFAQAMGSVGFGRFEALRLAGGELVLDPWPTAVRGIKFGESTPANRLNTSQDFDLKAQLADFFEYVRSVKNGEIRRLEIRHGLPFSVEVDVEMSGLG